MYLSLWQVVLQQQGHTPVSIAAGNFCDPSAHGHRLLRSPGNFPRVLVDLHSSVWFAFLLHCYPAAARFILFYHVLPHSHQLVLHMLNLLWHTAWISFTVHHFSRTNSVLQSRAFLFVCSYDCLAQDLHRPRCHARRDLPSLRLPEVLDPSLCRTLLRYKL